MHHLLRASALVCVIALLAWQQSEVQAEPKEGEWAKGWNTWATAAKGDWIEYSMGAVKFRLEVTEAKGGKVAYDHIYFNKGKESFRKNKKLKAWSAIKLQGKLPQDRNKVTWTKEEIELSGSKLSCDVASWPFGKGTTQIYYCKDVPCGGVVKTTSDGKDSVWVTSFHSEKSGEVKGPDPVVTESELPRFWATVGNRVILKITGTGRDTTYQCREISSVAKTASEYTIVTCEEDGTPDPKAKLFDKEQTKADWDKAYAKPGKTGVKLKVKAGEFECDVYTATDESTGKVTTEWVSEGALVKKVIKTKTSETTLELILIEWK